MLTINVTAEDIANGVRESCFDCPIAAAIRRLVPGVKDLEVDGDARWKTGDGWFATKFPEAAQEFIVAFDRGEAVGPLAFECDPILYRYGPRDNRRDDD